MHIRSRFGGLIVIAILLASLGAFARADAPQAVSDPTRDAFLKVIDRPRVPLAPEVKADGADAGIARFQFSYATQADQRVPGILYEREQFARDGKRHPVVIALHGTGGKKEGEATLLKRLANLDFIAIAIDGRYHGERGKPADYNAAIAKAFAQGTEHPMYYDTVWDVMRLIDYLQTRPDVDASRIGLIGFSKGGIETWLAAAADTRIAAAIPCIGVQSFEWALDNNAWPARVATVQKGFNAAARSSGVAHPDAAFVRRFYDRVLPGIYKTFDGPQMLPLISPRPLMVINGETDDKNPLEGLKLCTDAASIAYERDGVPDRFVVIIEPKTGHAVTKDAMGAAMDFFAKWIGNESKAPVK
ncbi:MAG TPA: dienelactone hydrolase family protein [Tepidisphaeraceae bacterium]|jgi:dienelactone hydrolase|nr:dienelactone hydrolase family protein [Tepidisphaeraceae bacterium]